MATMTLNVTTNVTGDNRPYVDHSRTVYNLCQKTLFLVVPCPVGQSRYVTIESSNTSSGTYVSSGSPYTFTITADTEYELTINDDPAKSAGETSYHIAEVALTNTSDPFFSLSSFHSHTGTAGC